MHLKEPIEKIEIAQNPRVAVVIPHFSATREDNLNRLVEDIKKQSFRDTEIIIVRGVSPQGRAINQGARLAKGEILMVMDDDSQIGDAHVIENLVRAIDENPSVAMAGASILTPEDANGFQKQAAKQFPRFNMPIVQELIDSDLPCHGCIAFRKSVFEEVGMERENIIRGLDPDLRVRIRNQGSRVVLVPQTWAYHPFPNSIFKFIRLFFRNGSGAAYIQLFHPEMNFDTDEKLESENFVAKRSFFYRLCRYPVRLVKSLITLQWIRFLGYFVYIFGYLTGFIKFSFLRLLNRPL